MLAPAPLNNDLTPSLAIICLPQSIDPLYENQVKAAIDADVTTHAALRSSETVYGHAKIYTSGGDLYIVTT